MQAVEVAASERFREINEPRIAGTSLSLCAPRDSGESLDQRHEGPRLLVLPLVRRARSGQCVLATEYDRKALTMTETRASIATLEDALAGVAKVGPVAREHAQKCEDGRRLAPEVIDAITDAGLWRAFGPKAIGDAGLGGLSEQFEILRALAYEDMSAAWGLFICGTSSGFVAARLSDAGRAEVFPAGGVPMAGVFNPGGSGAPAGDGDGGLVVSGRWPFASGVTYAQWVLANVIAVDDAGMPKPGIGGLPEIQTVVVRHEDVSLIDDWHVAGLRGTGSMTFTMESVNVPESRCFPFFGRATIDEPKYQLPIISSVAAGFASLAIGLAQRGLDEVVALLPTRVGPPSFEPASADPLNQVVVGRAQAAIRAALESTRAIFGRYDDRAARGDDLSGISLAERAEIHQHTVWVAETCQAVVNDLFRLGGASSIYEPGILQRVWRDINVLNQHLYVRGANHRTAGQVLLGFDVPNPLF
jgi:alkylation response protein AidB-like acyl-CoA dehydrogenase